MPSQPSSQSHLSSKPSQNTPSQDKPSQNTLSQDKTDYDKHQNHKMPQTLNQRSTSHSAFGTATLASSSNTQPLRIAINGFGRIGRNVLRALIERFDVLGRAIHLVAINDIADAQTLLHLLKFDSTHGRLSQQGVEVSVLGLGHERLADEQVCQLVLSKNGITYTMALMCVAQPEHLPWDELDIDLVLECTGHFRSYHDASRHLDAGAKQVIVGAAPFDRVDACIVMGVNHHELTRQHRVISSVSCTTQALVPLIDVLDKAFGAQSVMMTEIHAVTADQNVLDQPHRDLRRARASGHNIIPTTSSSIAATERTLPHMQGKINGHSIRVPTIDVAAIDVTFVFAKQSANTTKTLGEDNRVQLADVRQVLQSACQSDSHLYGIMGYTNEPLVSSDFIHQPESLIIDAQQLMQVGSQIKVFAWYDNEWGYANRLLDMCLHLQQH